MAEGARYRTLVETEEYAAQLDFLAARYSEEMLSRALTGVLWGIAENAEQYERVTTNIRAARSHSYAASEPRFKVFLQVLNDEKVLLLWIEEIGAIDEIDRPFQ